METQALGAYDIDMPFHQIDSKIEIDSLSDRQVDR